MFINDKYYSLKDKDIIKRTANETGYYHKPKFYVDYIQEQYGRTVSASHIVKVLGTYKQRIKRIDYQIALKIQDLLDMTRNDIHLINNILRRIYDERTKRGDN